ncbi:cysteine--tRNA ligase [Candidatus Beckwithbacteria bacterium]|nr:cysteine--tRNA ligase [Candidatus Beckwithbacteria bacterium]
MKIYNSLTRQLEDFQPINPPHVGVYTCGPTVYNYVSIGNWRTYFLGDLLVRTLKYLGYDVNYIMNITDVGHLTGDNLGDADTGEDKLQKAANREKKTAWDIAQFYIDDFLKGYKELNLTQPKEFCRATDYIAEQIELVKIIEAKGMTYRIDDGIYFDVGKYETEGNTYGELSNIDQVREGARVEPNPQKKDPRDFALWKFSYPKGRSFDQAQDDVASRRHMEWDSPWGVGFPGWHIECSAMSRKHLGDQFDIHIGGEDLRSTHHPNEVAQSECATGKKPFVKYWMHGAFLQVDGGRMGKSLGNAYILTDLEKKGFKPEHLRYFYLTGHYRQPLNFTWESLENARITYERLIKKILEFKYKSIRKEVESEYNIQFKNNLENDLNTPELLATIWKLISDNSVDNEKKYNLLLNWDEVLGLKFLERTKKKKIKFKYKGKMSKITIVSEKKLPSDVINTLDEREVAREQKDWSKADQIRNTLATQDLEIKDEEGKVIVK